MLLLASITGAATATAADLKIGDTAVTTAATPLMNGSTNLGDLPVGTKFTIQQQAAGWLYGSFQVDGRQLRGWVRESDVSKSDKPAPAAQSAQSGSKPSGVVAAAAQPSNNEPLAQEPAKRPAILLNVGHGRYATAGFTAGGVLHSRPNDHDARYSENVNNLDTIIWDHARARKVAAVQGEYLSPDGSLILRGTELRRTSDYRIVARLPSGWHPISGSPYRWDNGALAVSNSSAVAIYDINAKSLGAPTRLTTIRGRPGSAQACEFSPDGTILLVTAQAVTFEIDAANGKLIRRFNSERLPRIEDSGAMSGGPLQFQTAFSGDGSRYILVSTQGIQLPPKGGAPGSRVPFVVVHSSHSNEQWQIHGATLSHAEAWLSQDGKSALVSRQGHRGLTISAVESGEIQEELSLSIAGVYNSHYPNLPPTDQSLGRRIKVAYTTFLHGSDNVAVVYFQEGDGSGNKPDGKIAAGVVNTATGEKQVLWRADSEHHSVSSIHGDPSGEWLSIVMGSYEWLHWRKGSTRPVARQSLINTAGSSTNVAVDPTDRLFSLHYAGKNRRTGYLVRYSLFDTQIGAHAGNKWVDDHSEPTSIDFSRDGAVILVRNTESSLEGPARLFANDDLRGRKVVETNRRNSVLSPDGRFCAAFDDYDDKDIVEVFNCDTLEKVASLPEPYAFREAGAGLRFSPDGKCLVAMYQGVRVWDTATWKQIGFHKQHVNTNKGYHFFTSDNTLRIYDDVPGGRIGRGYQNAYSYRELDLRSLAASAKHSTEPAFASVNYYFSRARENPEMLISYSPLSDRNSPAEIAVHRSNEAQPIARYYLDAVNAKLNADGRLAITTHRDGWCRIWDASSMTLLCRLTVLNDGEDWLVHTPEGLFDGSFGGRQQVMYRVGDGLNVVPVDRFFQDFYYPGLLAALWRGERPMPSVELGGELPPEIQIVSPEAGDSGDREVLVTVSARDTGGGVKGPWLRHNGARLLGAVVETNKQGDTTTRVFRVRLVAGENTLEAQGASADGGFESEPDSVTLRYAKPLPKPRLHLAMVAISDYADDQLDLRHPVEDLQRLAGVFQQRGSALYEEVVVHPVVNERATRQGVLDAIDALAGEVEPQDSVILALAGHGMVIDGRFAFVPYEFKRTDAELEEDLREQALSAEDISSAAGRLPALKRLVMIDTGQSGGALPPKRTARDAFAFRGAVERLSRSQGMFMIAASTSTDTAREVEDLGYNVLPYTLLAGLNAVEAGPLKGRAVKPSGSDRVASAVEWFNYASGHSRRLSREYFGQEQDILYATSGVAFPVLPVGESAGAALDDTLPEFSVASQPAQSAGPSADKPGSGGVFRVRAIGVGAYQQQALSLKYAAADAEAIVRLATEQGASVHQQVDAVPVTNQQATAEGIRATLEQLAATCSEDDTVLLHISGHGAMVGQRYYLIPHEFTSTGGLMEDDIRKQGVPADALGDLMAKVPAKRRMIVFDTCASGGALRLNKQGADPFDFRGALDRVSSDAGVFMIAASGADQEAQEVDELGHGLLTYSLLAAAGAVNRGPLRDKPATTANASGSLDVLEWFTYASGSVPRLMKRYFGKEQQVRLSGSGKAFPVVTPN